MVINSVNSNKRLLELSVFFPLYNEEKNVERLVEESLRVFPLTAEKFEVILVNDGSRDSTEKIARELEAKYAEIKLVSQENMGYGGAVKRGFQESKYNWIFFSDGDLQFDLSEIMNLIPHVDDYDLIIGYRLNRAEGFQRNLVKSMLKIWNQILLGFPGEIKDIDCAFKLIKKEVVDSVNPLVSDGAMLSTEFLLKSYKKAYKIKQVGVKHYKREFGSPTGNNSKVILKAIKDTFKLRNHLSGY